MPYCMGTYHTIPYHAIPYHAITYHTISGYELRARTSQFAKRFKDFARQISFRNIEMRSQLKFFKIIAKNCREDNWRHTKLKRAFWLLSWIVCHWGFLFVINCANLSGFIVFFETGRRYIFTVMCFVEPIVCLFAICYLNMYVYSLFANIILLDTIYSPGVENVSDHGTNGPRKFLGLPENIQKQKRVTGQTWR